MPFDAANLTQHPLSAAYPAMEKGDFEALAADIRKVGLREPITVFEGQILDGWHRYNACMCENMPPEFVEFDEGDPVDFVRSKNRHRRHLTASQVAAAEIRLHEWRPRGGDGSNQHQSKSAPGAELLTSAEIAHAAGVSTRTVEQAKAAERAGLGDAVRDGKLSAKKAAEIAKAPAKVQAQAKKAIEAGQQIVVPAKKPEMTQAEKLEIENEDMRERLADMARDLEVYMKIEEADGKTDSVVKTLMEKIRVVETQRDVLLRENAELKREVKALQRKLGRK
jgi:hypothetical protein